MALREIHLDSAHKPRRIRNLMRLEAECDHLLADEHSNVRAHTGHGRKRAHGSVTRYNILRMLSEQCIAQVAPLRLRTHYFMQTSRTTWSACIGLSMHETSLARMLT
jgi:hypothetical protein